MRLIDADKLLKVLGEKQKMYLEIASLEEAIGYAQAMMLVKYAPTIQRWYRCEYVMPKHDESVLCCGGRGGMFVGKVCVNSGTKNGRAAVVLPGGDVRYCTHWMPLPELPEEDEDAD